MKLRSLALAGVMVLACALPAAAQSSSTFPVKDSTSTTRNFAGQADAAGAFHYRDIMEGLTSGGAPDAFLSDGAGHQLVTLFGTPAVSISNTPTVNIGSIGGGATASAQGTGNGTLASILAALGAPLQAGGKVDTVIVAVSANRGASFTSSAAVTLMAANTSRRGLQIQNQGSSSCYLNGLATATADFNSLLIPAGGLYESLPQHTTQGAVSVICPSATSSSPVPVYAREF